MLAISFGIFLLSCGRSPTADSSTCASMRGDSRYLACIKPPGKVGSDGFNFCRVFCTGLPQLLTSWALVCSLRGLFIAASLLSDPARFRVDTVPWLCALSPLNTSIGIVWRSLYSVLLLASCSKLRIAYEKATPRPLVCVWGRTFFQAVVCGFPTEDSKDCRRVKISGLSFQRFLVASSRMHSTEAEAVLMKQPLRNRQQLNSGAAQGVDDE